MTKVPAEERAAILAYDGKEILPISKWTDIVL